MDYVPVPVVPELLRAKVRVFADLYRKTRQLEQLNAELERRVAERTAELAQANAELEQRVEERTREREAALAQVHEMQKLESLGQLTGGVAHDFNNLLMVILGNLELLRKRLPEDPRLLRLVDGAMQGAERGATLTKRMLAFARRQELRPETVDVPRLVDGMEEMLRRTLGPGIQIVTAYRTDLPAIRVDPSQLELALLNLALNARDAMPHGGRLVIGGRCLAAGVGAPPELADGHYVCLTVSDTGAGMDEATLKRAAEPFFTTKGAGKGTGLGLSMVHGLAAQSGGAMRITSQPGDGTTVELWLPVSEAAAMADVLPQPASFGTAGPIISRVGGRRRSAGCRQHRGDAGGCRSRGERGAVRRARAGPAAAGHQGRCRGDRPRDARHDRQRTGAADQAALARAADHPGNRLCRTAERRGSRAAAPVKTLSCRTSSRRRSPRWWAGRRPTSFRWTPRGAPEAH